MTDRNRSTPVVVDTDALSWALDPRPTQRSEEVRRAIGTRTRVVSFVSVTELRYGALRAGWGELRMKRLDRSLADLDIVQTGELLILRCATLRAWAHSAGHPLAPKIHEADRWVAGTALALDLDLVAGDGIFDGVPRPLSGADREGSYDRARPPPPANGPAWRRSPGS